VAHRPVRKTKLIATIGPACDSPETLKAMVRAGMNVARLNFSHGTHEEHRKRLQFIREVDRELGTATAVMLDTKGVEIRTGRVEGGRITLTNGQDFSLHTDERLGGADGVSVSDPELPEDVVTGSAILLDDGVIELRVQEVLPREIRCRVTRGGQLADRKSLNVPGTSLERTLMSPENREDLLFAITEGIDYIAASFVRTAVDVRDIRQLLAERGAAIPILAKIESREGVRNLAEIVDAADGTMVARGDLGVEMPLSEVPMVQKKIIRTTVMNGKPVITATQMLDSMQRNPTPTRAEVSDVANAILDGTSAVMLSGETAAGAYPVEAVRTMAALALRAEAGLADYGHLQHVEPEPSNIVTEAVSQAAITMANHLRAAAIITLTESGFTSRQVSKHRPKCPILAVTTSGLVVRKLSMNWGVTAMRVDAAGVDEEMLQAALRMGRERGYLEPGDVVVATAGLARQSGSTNLIRVLTVDA
jgi:pyruvate kinase